MTIALDEQTSSVRSAFRDAAARRVDESDQPRGSSQTDSSKPVAGQDRTLQDTVELSAGAEKIVNLNRGAQLAESVKEAPVDKEFATTLRQATQDVFRITKLFAQTVRALFGR